MRQPPDGPGASEPAPGPSRQAWMAAFRRLCRQRGRAPEAVAAAVGLGHLIEPLARSGQELRLDHQAALAAALDLPLSELVACAEVLDSVNHEP